MTKKLIPCLLIFLCLCTCLAPFNMIWADEPNAAIRFSTNTADVGQDITVTLYFSNTTTNISEIKGGNLTYDETVVELVSQSGGGGNVPVAASATTPTNDFTITYTFHTLREGSSTFTLENCQLWDENNNLIGTASASNTLAVKNTSSLKSANAKLKSLTVSYGTLVPEFSPEITEYTVMVDYSVSKFPVTAEPEDAKATTSITENQTLAVGETTRVITVTAEDGTIKEYTITITRAAPEETATPTPTGTASATQTQKPTATQAQTQIQWGTPAQDITEAPDSSATSGSVSDPVATTPPTPSATTNTGITVNDLKNAIVTVVVIVAIIIIVILFTVVYCMQQNDKKKRGNSKGKRK